MLLKRATVPAVIFLAGFVACSCGQPSAAPYAPSPVDPARWSPSPQMLGTWELDLRLTKVTSNSPGCVVETMRAGLENAMPYRLTVTEGVVELADVHTEWFSSFERVTFDGTSFTTGSGTHTVGRWSIQCADGTSHDLLTIGGAIAGRLSGTDIVGKWTVGFFEIGNEGGAGWAGIETEFTGTR